MKRVILIIEYDGTSYVGWQQQPNGISVQKLITEAIELLTGERINLHASGRTDSGVHARAQVAHFDTCSRIPAEKFSYALNTILPDDIRIRASFEGDDGFHSRFGVQKKHYVYQIINSPHASAFTAHTALHVHVPLNLEALKRSAEYFLGEHDFLSFKASGSSAKTTVRTIYTSEWTKQGSYLYYHVAGNGFLYNMVRIMTGSMLLVGKGYKSPEFIKDALDNPGRENAGDTAPAHGLTLYRVEYNEFDTEEKLKEAEMFIRR